MENVITKSCKQFGTIRQIKENPALWCGSDVAKALGYANSRKAITDHCRCVTKRYIPHPQSPSKQIEVSFIPEADVYRLICHSKLPKAQEFEQWVFEDVVPKAVHGDEPQQMTFDDYQYFDKTFRGQPVLSIADIAAMINIERSTIGYSVRRYLKADEDYYLLEKSRLATFKMENPKFCRHVGSMYVVTASGFDKLCKIYGIKVDKPKLFIEEKPKEQKSKPTFFVTSQVKREMAEIRREAQRLINLTYLLDDSEGQVLCGETYHQYKSAIIRQMKAIGSCMVIPQKNDY